MAGPSPGVVATTYVGLLIGESGGTAGAGTPTATSGEGAGVLPPVQPVVAVLPPVQVPVEPVAQPAVGQVEALPLTEGTAVPGLPTLSGLSLTGMLAQVEAESGFVLSRGSTGGDPLAMLAESAGCSFRRPPLRGVAGLPRARPTSVPVQPSVRPRLDQEGWTGSTSRLLYCCNLRYENPKRCTVNATSLTDDLKTRPPVGRRAIPSVEGQTRDASGRRNAQRATTLAC